MAISVDTVYKTVLLILNKEQRGYMTPDEFNKIATQVQLETFENYFESLNQQLRVPDNDSEYADRIKNIDEKIAIFKKYATATYSTDHFTLPTDLYRLGTVVYKDDTEAQLIQRNDLLYVNQSPLTKPTEKYPLYLYEDNKLYLKPASINSNISVSYVKKPADVVWNFTIPEGQNYYAYDAANSTDFELDVSEQPEVIIKVLLYAGVVVKDYQIVQLAAQEIQSEEINQKS
ncbi:MAG: hypothetical protein ACR2M9_03520 [Cyanophyceae cyanobacterium]|jgi:hypothetical protein